MFDAVRDFFRQSADARQKRQDDHVRREQARHQDAERRKRAEQERQRRIQGIRVITGEIRYRYAILETVRAHGFYLAEPGQPYHPTEATERAIRSLQEQAFALGADAVIHAQYQILRYTLERRQFQHTPAYEAHAFGTAVKILGPPPDWPEQK